MMLNDELEAIILDVGSGSIKAGFGNDEVPKCFIPTIVGELKNSDKNKEFDINNFYFG